MLQAGSLSARVQMCPGYKHSLAVHKHLPVALCCCSWKISVLRHLQVSI